MSKYRRKDARHYPILTLVPGLGTGIQVIWGRTQPYCIWNNFEIEEFCTTKDKAYSILQEVLDGYRTGEDYEEEEEEKDDGGNWD